MKCPYCQSEMVAIPVLKLQGCPECNLLAPSVVVKKLIAIEGETAEKCAEIIGHISDGADSEFATIGDLQAGIREHFSRGKTEGTI